jgi:hypothetical protein
MTCCAFRFFTVDECIVGGSDVRLADIAMKPRAFLRRASFIAPDSRRLGTLHGMRFL